MTQDDGLFALEVEEPELEAVEPEVVETRAPLPAIPVQPIQAGLIKFETEVRLWQEQAGIIKVIQDDATNNRAAEIALGAKKVFKLIDDLEEYHKRPHLDFNSAVRNFAKKFKDPLDQIVKTMGRLQGNYRLLQENKKRQEAAALERERQEQQKNLQAEADAAEKKGEVYTPVELPAPVVEPIKTVVHTASGTASQVQRYVAELVDETKVEREFLTVDWKKVNEAVKGGRREINGFIVKEDFTARYRV